MNYHYDTTSGGQFFANAYGQYYRLDLFTNFTFFLNDPVNGDGIQQSDRRVMYGGDIGYKQRRRGAGCAEHWDGRVSNQSGQYPRSTGDPNDENADRDHDRQRYSRGVLCAVRQSGGAADVVDATGWRIARRNVHVRCAESLRDVCGTICRPNKFRPRPPENESYSGPLGRHRILCQLWRGLSQQRRTIRRCAGILAACASQEL